MVKLGFERCYMLDDGGRDALPPYLTPLAVARTVVAAVLLVMIMLATPFWHSTPIKVGVSPTTVPHADGVAVQPVGAISR
jgi:uncharacterized protein (DUF983 family)